VPPSGADPVAALAACWSLSPERLFAAARAAEVAKKFSCAHADHAGA
jgi:hypothetical protein